MRNFSLLILPLILVGCQTLTQAPAPTVPVVTPPAPAVPPIPTPTAQPIASVANATVTSIPVYGDSSHDVATVQNALIAKGASISADSDFGPATKSAVAIFQKMISNPGGGVLNTATLTALGITIVPLPPTALDWEKTIAGSSTWSAALIGYVTAAFPILSKATDIGTFCPTFASLTDVQKIHVLSELMVWTAYFESSWEPAENSQDVGTAANKDTWSVGLWQMSVVDQANYGLKFGYTFSDLQQPGPNARLAIAVLSHQVAKYGTILIPAGSPGLYWATLHPGGKYDASSSIKSHTKAITYCQP